MSEIVFTHTVENRDNIATMEFGQMPTDRKVTIFVNPDKVAYVTSTLVVGMPRGHSDKRYYNWRTVGSKGFFRNRSGNPQPYDAHRPWNFKRETPWKHFAADEVFSLLETHEEFRRAVWETFGFNTLEQMYPIAAEYGLPSYRHMPYDLRPSMREADWDLFITKAFGKTRATPRLVAAAKNTEPYIVALGHQFRGLVPDEDMVSFIENNHFDDDMMEAFDLHNPNVRPLLFRLTPDARKGILGRGLDLSDTHRINRLTSMGKRNLERYGDNADADSWSAVLGGR